MKKENINEGLTWEERVKRWSEWFGGPQCNGWANRETWSVALHFGDALHEYSAEIIRSLYEEGQKRGYSDEGLVRVRLEDALQAWFEELADNLEETKEGRSILRDIGSTWRICWPQITWHAWEELAAERAEIMAELNAGEAAGAKEE